MKYLSLFFLLYMKAVYALLPIIDHPEDIARFFPETKEKIYQIQENAAKEFEEKVSQIIKLSPLFFKEIINLWDEAYGNFRAHANLFETIALVYPEKSLRKAALEAHKLMEKAEDEILLKNLKIAKLFTQIGEFNLDPKLSYYVEQRKIFFTNKGMNLSKRKRNKWKNLQEKLHDLCSFFSSTINEDTSHIIASAEELEGVDQVVIDGLTKNADQTYTIYCDYPSVFPILRDCTVSTTRKKMLHAFYNRAYPQNLPVLEQIIEKRNLFAQLLGAKSYAHLQLESMMCKKPEEAQQFLENIFKKLQGKQQQEFTNLAQNLSSKEDLFAHNAIPLHNVSFLWKKYMEENFSIDPSFIKEFFPLEIVLEKTLKFFEEFFEVTVQKVDQTRLWVEDLIILQIKQDNRNIGFVILDLFPRAGKFSHACMCPIIPSWDKDQKSSLVNLNMVVTNFPKPTKNTPSLLSIEQVRTLYHELGHSFHEILGRGDKMLSCGTRVCTDFVEMPSQIMEEWLYQPLFLKNLSCHYLTKKSLDEKLIEKIVGSRSAQIATELSRQILFSEVSLKYFSGGKKDTQKIFTKLYKKYQPYYLYDPNLHFQAAFGHLDSYGAAYYGYLWSKVIALDNFTSFLSEDGLKDLKKVKAYRRNIIEKGGSEDPNYMLKNYLKRTPNLFSFLQRLQINAMEKEKVEF